MEENCTNKKSNREEQIKEEPDREESQENPCEPDIEDHEKSGDHKKIERCEPCLHCGSHCIYLNRE